ncbi:MAG: DUF6498-containing protein, partial [Candidatus Diapherotrites archaeon]|nr:DUF6498-containing protein [Candidatus Diapherotrites archaeon]
FLVTHLISFFMFKEEAKNITNPNTFVFEPLPRILPVHLTIILGMFIFLYIPQESSVLFFFLGLKTLIDILMHDWQHEKHDVLKNTQKAQISA